MKPARKWYAPVPEHCELCGNEILRLFHETPKSCVCPSCFVSKGLNGTRFILDKRTDTWLNREVKS